ncbi:MAG: putative ATPase/DNA-binding CsgD family transcriptional regulator [Paracoccaceae bacterium]|jgi:predicted ATPase/DNA-binding CsgD family transcriptional regulator
MPQTNLPLDLSPLLGREADLSDVRATLREHRLVTLAGPGGAGKTRLAKKVARSVLEHFEHGVWFIDLVGVFEPAGVAGAVSRLLDVQEELGIPLADTLANHLMDQEVLLVLDNCEQVLDGCADFVKVLLTSAPNTKILTTSREPLHVGGEYIRKVPPLSQKDGVKLFCERALQVSPDFMIDKSMEGTITEIVKRLDALPLAIELAAARLPIMNPSQILSGLDERFALLTGGTRDAMTHHKSLGASVAWSYDLMAPSEQQLAKQLCVLQGFTLAAARSIGNDGISSADDVLDLLQRLVDMSMLQVDRTHKTPRYRFLESVRLFLLQKLNEARELDAARARHLSHFVDFAETRAPRLVFGEGPEFLSQIQTEFDNLETALTYADTLGDPGMLLRLLTALSAYYELRGQFQHGIRWFDRAMAKEPSPDVLLARALWAASHVCAYGGRMDLVFPNVQNALELAQELGDPWTEARALEIIGFAQSVSQPIIARETMLKCIAIGHQAGDDWAESHGIKMMTAVCLFSHDSVAAKLAISDLVACSEQFDSRYLLAWAKALTGYFGRDSGDFEAAERALVISLENSNFVGDPATSGFAKAWYAALKADQGQVDVAREELQNLMETATRSGAFLAVAEAMFLLGSIEVAAGNPKDALDLIGGHVEELRNAGIPIWSEQLALVSAAANVALGQFTKAEKILNEAAKQAVSLNNPLINGLSYFIRGRLALARNDTGEAEAQLHEALSIQIAAGLKPGQLRTLEFIAEILFEKEKFEDAVRVLAVVDRERRVMPLVRGAGEVADYQALVEKLSQAIGKSEFEDIGSSMENASLDEAIELISRMRGKRARPLMGWPSLTPTERRVVTLATEGLSNPEIAARMFIARGTVKIHLSHIFEKLDVKSRTQLATKAVAEAFEEVGT